MPRPRTPLSTGKSGRANSTPTISRDSSAIRLRRRTVDPHVGQSGTSRPVGAAGRSHAAPQILQVKLPEPENVKRRPPIAILDSREDFFLVLLAPRQILQCSALLRMDGQPLGVRDEDARSITQDGFHCLVAARVRIVHG